MRLGVLYVEWDDLAKPPKPRYFGYGDIDGKRVRLEGDIDTSSDVRRVRLVIRESKDDGKRKAREGER